MPRWRLHYNAPFTLTFALLCALAFVAAVLSQGWTNTHVFSVGRQMDMGNPISYLRPFLHILGHGYPQHLVFNLSMLLLVGPTLEERYGWQALLGISLVTALLTAGFMILFVPGILLGASGVVFACIVLGSFANAKGGTIPLTFVCVAALFLGNEVYRAFTTQDNVAQFAHLLGGLVGAAYGFWKLR